MTFTLRDGSPIDSVEQPYTISFNPIQVAHPMEMKPSGTIAWQKYFTIHGLKQPFAQVWEPVRRKEEILENRYVGCMIPYYRFRGKEKHCIYVMISGFNSEIQITAADCNMDIERIDWHRHELQADDRFEIKSFKFRKFTRQINHLVTYFDRITIWDRVRKDDLTVMEMISNFTLAQIAEFIDEAQEAGANNVLAALLEYKNSHFADYNPMDEFTLE